MFGIDFHHLFTYLYHFTLVLRDADRIRQLLSSTEPLQTPQLNGKKGSLRYLIRTRDTTLLSFIPQEVPASADREKADRIFDCSLEWLSGRFRLDRDSLIPFLAKSIEGKQLRPDVPAETPTEQRRRNNEQHRQAVSSLNAQLTGSAFSTSGPDPWWTQLRTLESWEPVWSFLDCLHKAQLLPSLWTTVSAVNTVLPNEPMVEFFERLRQRYEEHLAGRDPEQPKMFWGLQKRPVGPFPEATNWDAWNHKAEEQMAKFRELYPDEDPANIPRENPPSLRLTDKLARSIVEDLCSDGRSSPQTARDLQELIAVMIDEALEAERVEREERGDEEAQEPHQIAIASPKLSNNKVRRSFTPISIESPGYANFASGFGQRTPIALNIVASGTKVEERYEMLVDLDRTLMRHTSSETAAAWLGCDGSTIRKFPTYKDLQDEKRDVQESRRGRLKDRSDEWKKHVD